VIGALAGVFAGSPTETPISGNPPMPIDGRIASDPQLATKGAWAWMTWTSPDGADRRSRLSLPLSSTVIRGDQVAVTGYVDGVTGDAIEASSLTVTQQGDAIERLRARARASIARAVRTHVPGSSGALAMGLLIGDDSALTFDEREELRGAGLSHLTAVSGWNVSFVTATIGSLVLAIGWRGWRSAGIQVVALAMFVWLVGGDPPVVRAAIMGVAAIVAARLGRPAHSFTVLVLAAATMVAASPEALTSLSFQLSLLATIGVILGARCTMNASRGVAALVTPIATTAIVGLATAPVVALQIGTFTPPMIPANLMAAPLAAPATILAVVVCLTSPIPAIAELIGWVAWTVCSVVLAIARVTSELRFGQMKFAPISAESTLALYAVGLLALTAALPEGRVAARNLGAWIQREPQPATAATLVFVGVLGVMLVVS